MLLPPAPRSPPPPATTTTRSVTGSHNFVITGCSLAKGMGSANTSPATPSPWAIYLYSDGKNPEDNAAYVSVFVALASDGTAIIDQTDTGRPYTLEYCGQHVDYKCFFRPAALETSDFLKDDCLKTNCTVGIVMSTMDYSRLHSIQVPDSDIGAHASILLESQEASDIVFDLYGENIYAHKLVFAARSPVFKAEFFEGHGEYKNEIAVPIWNQRFLRPCYTSFTETVLLKMMFSCHKFSCFFCSQHNGRKICWLQQINKILKGFG